MDEALANFDHLVSGKEAYVILPPFAIDGTRAGANMTTYSNVVRLHLVQRATFVPLAPMRSSHSRWSSLWNVQLRPPQHLSSSPKGVRIDASRIRWQRPDS